MTPDTSDTNATHEPWDPHQYLKFADERFRAAVELLQRVPVESPSAIVDLGCGTGEMTRLIADHWPSATVTGIDSSSAMLEQARAHSPDINWVNGTIENWIPNHTFDLIYSNAALHWVSDHKQLFPRLVESLSDRGCLAVQMPLSWPSRSHALMRETLANGGPDGAPLGPIELRAAMARKGVNDGRWYHDLLADSVRLLDIWESEYLQILDGEDAVLEWVRGTGLRPILQQLEKGDIRQFMDAYRLRLREAYPRNTRGKTLYPFRRLFIVAQK